MCRAIREPELRRFQRISEVDPSIILLGRSFPSGSSKSAKDLVDMKKPGVFREIIEIDNLNFELLRCGECLSLTACKGYDS